MLLLLRLTVLFIMLSLLFDAVFCQQEENGISDEGEWRRGFPAS